MDGDFGVVHIIDRVAVVDGGAGPVDGLGGAASDTRLSLAEPFGWTGRRRRPLHDLGVHGLDAPDGSR